MDLPIPGARDVRATLDDPATDGSPTCGDDGRGDADRDDDRSTDGRSEGGGPAGDRAATGAGDRLVVACPPHPQMGGDRTDSRLRAVGDRLGEFGVACLRIDYGPWDGGRGETVDARAAVRWGRERYRRVGLFGYSFGGAVATLAAAGDRRDGGGENAGVGGDGPRAGAGGDAPADPGDDGTDDGAEGRTDGRPFGPPAPPDALAVLAPASRLGAAPELDAVAALGAVDCPVRVVYGARDDTADWRPLVDRARELGHDAVELGADHHFVGQRSKAARPVAEFLDDRL